jgi:hypothetical protein
MVFAAHAAGVLGDLMAQATIPGAEPPADTELPESMKRVDWVRFRQLLRDWYEKHPEAHEQDTRS